MIKTKRPVLILNKSWIPIRVRNVEKAIKLVVRNKAMFIDPNNYEVYNWDQWCKLENFSDNFIKTPKSKVKLPEVIVLSLYNKMHTKRIRLTKKNILIRDNFVCQYTGIKLSHKKADIDHVIPKSKGGKDSWDNLVVTSKELNRKKGNKTNREAGLKLIKIPQKPNSSLWFDPKIKYPESWKKFIFSSSLNYE